MKRTAAFDIVSKCRVMIVNIYMFRDNTTIEGLSEERPYAAIYIDSLLFLLSTMWLVRSTVRFIAFQRCSV